MRPVPVVAVIFLSALFSAPLQSQQPTAASASPQAESLLQRARAALSGANPISDVTLTGTARRIAGSDDESGSVTLKATLAASRIDMSLPSGPHTEVRNNSADAQQSGAQQSGAWSGKDGVSHAAAFHNLLTEPAWFFPSFAVLRSLANSGYVVTLVGHETKDSVAVDHLSLQQNFSTIPAPQSTLLQHLSQVDLYLDSSTLLPVAMTFNIHPDNNANLDIPIEIRYSDYRLVNGAQVPFHIQKFLNNGLILDLQLTTATLNTGLASSIFATQ
ncbi:MAG TPA: hypothetical protein VGI16_03720 [Candidatus Acidoferrum sp.]